jgi:hypothetical protein
MLMSGTELKIRLIGLEAYVQVLELRIAILETKLGLGPKKEDTPAPKTQEDTTTVPYCSNCGEPFYDNATICTKCNVEKHPEIVTD